RAVAATVKAAGYNQGGTLAIQAPKIQIGGAPTTDPGTFYLPETFFDGNVFGGYSLTSTLGDLTVVPGATVRLTQRNYDPLIVPLATPSGARMAEARTLTLLSDSIRAPVGLNLSSFLPLVPYSAAGGYDPLTAPEPAKVALRIGEGARLLGDPGAAVSLR